MPQRSMFNEATRVQMPALVHLTRIGYQYYGKIHDTDAGTVYDPDTNILIKEFCKKFDELNPTHEGEGPALLRQIRQELDNDDLGESFYKRLRAVSPVKLIDYDHPEKNSYYCTAEFTCRRDEDEFRPDITLFINGLPLVFIEVKKPNNVGGMVAEAERMNRQRFPNKKFRRFINITQLMIFSNNMEYDAMGGIVPLQGVFYCTAAKKYAPFNCFREENPLNHPVAPYNAEYSYLPIVPETEKRILEDFNNQVMGYRTTVSPQGGDGGIDIIAYKDELPPRIAVQVKSQDGDIKETVIQSLKGAMMPGDYGLFVTLSNYTKNAQKFLIANPIIRGINGTELVDLILKYYEELDKKYQKMIPLKMVYIPVPSEE